MAGMKVKTTRKFAAFHSPTCLLFSKFLFLFDEIKVATLAQRRKRDLSLRCFIPLA